MPVLVDREPVWIDESFNLTHADEDWHTIFDFFVIHTPCPTLSAQSITLEDRGWRRGMWASKTYLKDGLDRILFGHGERQLHFCERYEDLSIHLTGNAFGNEFYRYRQYERAAILKCSKRHCGNEYMSLFYHIRNALAHGRFRGFNDGSDVIIALEDGMSTQGDELIKVSARILIRKSTIINFIDYLTHPPVEDIDWREAVYEAIESGFDKKSKVMMELGISESSWKYHSSALRIQGRIEYRGNRWQIAGTQN